MLSRLSATLASCFIATTLATVTTTFEGFGLAPDSYLNDAGTTGYFTADGHEFNNQYNPDYDSWYGWAISNTTDTTTPGYLNQYSAITGGGADGSDTYAVGYTFGDPAFLNMALNPSNPSYQETNPFHPSDTILTLDAGTSPESIQVTNTTYTYLACRDGDPYQFGTAFTAGDYLMLDVRGYDSGGNLVGTVEFYLADYTSSNPADWSIVDTWQTLDLTPLAGSATLRFGIQSSQNDPMYGVIPPAYFAADNFVVSATP